MNLFKQFITAIYKFKDYPKLMELKKGSVISYFLIFNLLLTSLTFIPLYIEYRQLGGYTGILETTIPDFEINNGKLSTDKIAIDEPEQSMKIYIDTNDENIGKYLDDSYMFYIIANSDNLYIKNINRYSEFKFANITENISGRVFKDRLLAADIKYSIIFGIGIIVIISLLISSFITILMLTLIVNIINTLFFKLKIRFSTLMKLAIYARTFPDILAVLIGLVGFSFSSIITWGITLTYIYLGLKNYKNNSTQA